MLLIKSFLLLFLMSFSGVSLADTYNATVTSWKLSPSNAVYNTSEQTACYTYWFNYYGYTTATVDTTVSPNVCHAGTGAGYQTIAGYTFSCPYGGTVSGTSCINAPSCNTGDVRNSVSGACQTPPTCTSPAVYDNPSNSCLVPACPTGQSRSPLSPYNCVTNPTCPAVMPLCSSVAFDCNNGDGTQQHVIQCSTVCATGQTMVGGVCVDNKTSPTSCPAGTSFNTAIGECESAAPIVCPAGTRPGTLNGDSVCASSSSVDPTKSRVPKATNTGTETGTGTITTTNKDANGNVTGTSTSTTTNTANITMDTTGLANQSTQQGILNALTEANTTATTVTPAVTTGLDTSETTAEGQGSITNPAGYFIQSFVVLPSAQCQPYPMTYKALNYTLDPCTKLQSFRDMLGYFFYIITALFIYQTATRPAGD